MEPQPTAGPGEEEVAEFAEHREVGVSEETGGPALAAVAGRGIGLVDQLDDIEEAPAGAGAHAGANDADREAGFAGAGPADQDEMARLLKEGASGKVAEQRLVDWRVIEGG